MKKAILLSGALLALTATVAAAAPGLNLSWNACGSVGVQNKNFACASNSGNHNAIGSFVSGDTEGRTMAGNDIVIDLQSAGAVLPEWWKYKNAGSCRASSASTNQVFAAAENVDDGDPLACHEIFNGLGGGGIAAYNVGFGGPNRARIIVAYGLAASDQQVPAPDQEYASFKLVINSAKSVGTGSCLGCQEPVCIVLNEVKQTTPGGQFTIRIGSPAARNFITWQGGSIAPPGCPGATPTRNTTWGTVKALYR